MNEIVTRQNCHPKGIVLHMSVISLLGGHCGEKAVDFEGWWHQVKVVVRLSNYGQWGRDC